MTTSALVLFSGGQDSTTCLAWALDRYECVETVGFDYGQRHRVELDCRPAILQCIRASFPRWGDRLGSDHVLDIPVLATQAMQSVLRLGMDCAITVETPLMWLTKEQTWLLAYDLGGRDLVELIREETHTCYL